VVLAAVGRALGVAVLCVEPVAGDCAGVKNREIEIAVETSIEKWMEHGWNRVWFIKETQSIVVEQKTSHGKVRALKEFDDTVPLPCSV